MTIINPRKKIFSEPEVRTSNLMVSSFLRYRPRYGDSAKMILNGGCIRLLAWYNLLSQRCILPFTTHRSYVIITLCFRTIIVAVVLSVYLAKYDMPVPVWTPSRGFRITYFPIHRVFSVSFWFVSSMASHFSFVLIEHILSVFLALCVSLCLSA